MRRVASMLIALLAITLIMLPATASADLGGVLDDIEWGDDKETVLEKIRSAKLNELRDDDRLRADQRAMQTARQQALDRMRHIEDSYTVLEGDRTGFEVSVIAPEFTADNNESMLRVRDNIAQRFYFFLEGEFYKLVIAYDEEHIENVGFQNFVEQTGQQYGSPSSTGDETVTWRDSDHLLTVRDQRSYFGTYTMTFSDRERVEELERAGETFGGNDEEPEDVGVSERVEAVTTPGEDESQGVVDDMIGGEQLDVDFSTDEEEDEADEEEEATAAADEPDPQPQQDEPSPAPTQPAGGDDDDDDDDVVIY